MKAKIASLEGQVRNSKNVNGQLERQIKMLERALKTERSKSKTPSAGDKVQEEEPKDVKGKGSLKPDLKCTLLFDASIPFLRA